MCGIAGSVNFPFQPAIINQVMGHRGPDEQDSFQHGQVQLHHLRLAILDLVNGHQPMHYLDRYTIVFNGEIYNHQELRSGLSLQCKTGSDTETILHAFHQEGPAMLNRMDGMFALAIYDRQDRKLFLARDRAGKKPLYYYFDGQAFVFASELNALKALLPLEINNEHLSAYLRLGSMYRHQTPYQKVTELEGGSWLMVLIEPELKLTKTRWWNIADHYLNHKKPTETEALHTIDGMLQKAVQMRLESSDLEVGSFLSGGIDSGLVTAMAAQLHPRLKTFTVSFPGAYDEAPLAKLVAEKYGTDHQEIAISFDRLAMDVESIITQYGEPFFDSSAIPSWYVSQAAKKHVTVVLNGDGADELFGGYRRYVPFSKYDFFKSGAALKGLSGLASRILPPGHEKKSTYNYAYRLLELASKKGFSAYLSAGVDIFEGFENNILNQNNYLDDLQALFNNINQAPVSSLQKLMWLDFEVNLFNDLLVKMDIATMAHSLEGRSPLLSKDLLEYVPGLPDAFKIRGKSTKWLLRNLAMKYLPEPLIHQPKRGFEIPLKNWVDTILKDQIFDRLRSIDALYPFLISKPFMNKLMENKIHLSSEKRAKILWTVYSLEVWYQKIYKGG